MRARGTSLLCSLAAAAGMLLVHDQPAMAGWDNGNPVFESDLERQRAARAAERSARRKSYKVKYPRYMKGGARPDIQPEKPDIVYLDKKERPGTIIVDTKGRKLYYVLPGDRAYSYPISVGRQGFTWTGTERISRIKSWPSWTPPAEMRRRQPGLPITVSGGVINPLGAKALYLGSSIYRIHGTNNKRSIGRASSSGCFRMMNKHVVHLAKITRIGTRVRVVRTYNGVSDSMPLSALFSSFGSDETPNKKKKN
ncbi:MAG: L,D-transpeptidase [Hyphomicrobiaceae bacterium]